jgi:colicin import membrane protein
LIPLPAALTSVKRCGQLLLGALGLCGLTALAQTPLPTSVDQSLPTAMETSIGQERQRIQTLREQLAPRFNADETACYQRFAVNDCLTQVRRLKREAIADLRRQEVTLNQQEAKRKGAEQLSRLEDRAKPELGQNDAARREQAQQEQQDRTRDNTQRAVDRAVSTDPRKLANERTKANARRIERVIDRSEKAAAAARAKAELAQRVQEASKRKAENLQRLNEQRAAKAVPVKPLPNVMAPLAPTSPPAQSPLTAPTAPPGQSASASTR